MGRNQNKIPPEKAHHHHSPRTQRPLVALQPPGPALSWVLPSRCTGLELHWRMWLASPTAWFSQGQPCTPKPRLYHQRALSLSRVPSTPWTLTSHENTSCFLFRSTAEPPPHSPDYPVLFLPPTSQPQDLDSVLIPLEGYIPTWPHFQTKCFWIPSCASHANLINRSFLSVSQSWLPPCRVLESSKAGWELRKEGEKEGPWGGVGRRTELTPPAIRSAFSKMEASLPCTPLKRSKPGTVVIRKQKSQHWTPKIQSEVLERALA